MALDLNNLHHSYWNRKAIILEVLKRYAESEECYNRSLALSRVNVVCDNKADSDAIAVYAGSEKIGYVANTMSTSFYLTSKASELKNTIDYTADAVYLLYIDRYLSIQYAIGKIIS